MTLLNQALFAARRVPSVRIALTATCLLGVAMASGCEDAEAQQRVEAQQTITKASTDFRNMTAGSVSFGDEHFDQRLRDLNAVVNQVSSLSNAEAGQQAAGGILAAEALSELAALHLAQARHIQQISRENRREIESLANAAARLDARAKAQAAISTSDEKADLQRERQATEQALNELSQRISALQGPIEDRTRTNQQDAEEADELRTQANDLIRRAIELGHASGFQSFQQAISTRRDADGIDYEIAMRELELAHELEPQQAYAQLQVEHLQRLVESIRSTLADFDELERLLENDLQQTRRSVSDLQQQIADSMRSLGRTLENELNEQFSTARGHLERATAQASQAAGRLRGDAAGSARLTQAKTYESLAQALWAEANAVAEHAQLLTQLVELGDAVGSSAEYRANLQAMNTRYEELIEEAKSAFAEAEQALASVTGKAAESVELFRQNLARANNAISGEAIGPAPRATSPSSSSNRDVPTGGGQGFDSLEDARQFLATMDWSNSSDVDRFFAAVDMSTPGATAMVQSLRPMLESMFELERAVRDQFGDLGSDAGMSPPDFSSAYIQQESGSSGTIAFDTAMGEDTLELINRDGQWLFDSSDLADDMAGGDDVDVQVMQRMAAAMSQAFSGLAQRVRNGEFSSAEEFQQVAGETMMQIMMQSMQ